MRNKVSVAPLNKLIRVFAVRRVRDKALSMGGDAWTRISRRANQFTRRIEAQQYMDLWLLGDECEVIVMHVSKSQLNLPKPKALAKKRVPVKFMTFGQALDQLLIGKMVRRRGWNNPETKLFRLDDRLYIDRANRASGGPMKWSPWANDILSRDWLVVDHQKPTNGWDDRGPNAEDESDD